MKATTRYTVGTPPYSGIWETIQYAPNGGWSARRLLCWNIKLTTTWYSSDAEAGVPTTHSADMNTSGLILPGDPHTAYGQCIARLTA